MLQLKQFNRIGNYCATILPGVMVAGLIAYLAAWFGFHGAIRLFICLSSIWVCAGLNSILEVFNDGKKNLYTESCRLVLELGLGIAIIYLLDYVIVLLWRPARLPVDLIVATIWAMGIFTSAKNKITELRLTLSSKDSSKSGVKLR